MNFLALTSMNVILFCNFSLNLFCMWHVYVLYVACLCLMPYLLSEIYIAICGWISKKFILNVESLYNAQFH